MEAPPVLYVTTSDGYSIASTVTGAGEPVISLNTVARHGSHIFEKTGVANRAEATGYAHRNGLV